MASKWGSFQTTWSTRIWSVTDSVTAWQRDSVTAWQRDSVTAWQRDSVTAWQRERDVAKINIHWPWPWPWPWLTLEEIQRGRGFRPTARTFASTLCMYVIHIHMCLKHGLWTLIHVLMSCIYYMCWIFRARVRAMHRSKCTRMYMCLYACCMCPDQASPNIFSTFQCMNKSVKSVCLQGFNKMSLFSARMKST